MRVSVHDAPRGEVYCLRACVSVRVFELMEIVRKAAKSAEVYRFREVNFSLQTFCACFDDA